MGVESDRLVFDYLSRVGDLAQTALPAAQRMRLVARLRDDIDNRRVASDGPAAVRRILGQLGTPDEVVEAAATGAGRPSHAEGPQVPAGGPGRRTAGGRGSSGRSGPSGTSESPGAPGSFEPSGSSGSSGKGVPGPRGAAPDAAGSPDAWDAGEPQWWRVDRRGDAPRVGDEIAGLPGMTGGVFVSFTDDYDDYDGYDDRDDYDGEDRDDGEPGGGGENARGSGAAGRGAVAGVGQGDARGGGKEDGGTVAAPGGRRTPGAAVLRRLGTGWGSPMLLLAAALLVGGAATGSLIVLALGWALAYLSRALTRTQAKSAVLGIPAGAAAGLVVWVWGRDTGHWGTPIAQGQMGQAFQHGYPVAVRLAALATALYLLRRARRS